MAMCERCQSELGLSTRSSFWQAFGDIDWAGVVRPVIVLVLVVALVAVVVRGSNAPAEFVGLVATLTTWLFKDRSDTKTIAQTTAAIYAQPPVPAEVPKPPVIPGA